MAQVMVVVVCVCGGGLSGTGGYVCGGAMTKWYRWCVW